MKIKMSDKEDQKEEGEFQDMRNNKTRKRRG